LNSSCKAFLMEGDHHIRVLLLKGLPLNNYLGYDALLGGSLRDFRWGYSNYSGQFSFYSHQKQVGLSTVGQLW